MLLAADQLRMLTVGKKYPNRKRKLPDSGPSKTTGQDKRKQDITARTQRGETAEQIADALAAQGDELKKGASTVWRLQTYWGLIPYDAARARGKHAKNRAAAQKNAPSAPRRRVPPTPADSTVFYPTNCAHGPQKRVIVPRVSGEIGAPMHVDPSFDSYPEPLPDMMDDSTSDHAESDAHAMLNHEQKDHVPPAPGRHTATVNVAAQIMSAELLVDLATSTLAAANRLKELYVAQQMQRPARGSSSDLPPTDGDIADAKLKVREAAGVMHDLAT